MGKPRVGIRRRYQRGQFALWRNDRSWSAYPWYGRGRGASTGFRRRLFGEAAKLIRKFAVALLIFRCRELERERMKALFVAVRMAPDQSEQLL